MMKHKVAIAAKHLHLVLGGKCLLKDVSIDINHGQLTTLLGTNGAGKSSLLKVLSAEIEPSLYAQTSLLYWGVNKKRLSRSVRAQNMGVLAQQSSLSFSFTVEEVVQLGLLPLSLSSRKATQVIDEVMQKVGVSEFKHRAYPSLSGGEKQRVHLARVLVQLSQAGQKAILMLDEPTSALDLAHQHKILSIAREMAEKGAAVIVVLHDLNLAAQYSDRIMVLNNGKIEADGSPWQVLTKQMILAVYGYACLVQKHPIKDHPMIYSIK